MSVDDIVASFNHQLSDAITYYGITAGRGWAFKLLSHTLDTVARQLNAIDLSTLSVDLKGLAFQEFFTRIIAGPAGSFSPRLGSPSWPLDCFRQSTQTLSWTRVVGLAGFSLRLGNGTL